MLIRRDVLPDDFPDDAGAARADVATMAGAKLLA